MYFCCYSPTQQGYKCYSPTAKHFYVSYDVFFLEHQPYYLTSLQGEISTEEKQQDLSLSLPNILHPIVSTNSSPLNEPNVFAKSATEHIPKLCAKGAKNSIDLSQPSEQPFKVYSRRPKISFQIQSSELNASSNLEETRIEDDFDVPIAIRKGVRSYTKHPISNYLTYAKKAQGIHCFSR